MKLSCLGLGQDLKLWKKNEISFYSFFPNLIEGVNQVQETSLRSAVPKENYGVSIHTFICRIKKVYLVLDDLKTTTTMNVILKTSPITLS